MSYERKPMTGTIFREASENPRAPIFTGHLALEDGREIRIALWVATDLNGEPRLDKKNKKKYFSAKLSWPERQEHSDPADTTQSENPEDDLGF